nr:hypothetical protein [Tanacetum cinerariifolium]
MSIDESNYFEPNPSYYGDQPSQNPIDQSPLQEMSIQDMEVQKQQYLEEMKSMINQIQIEDYRNERIDIHYRRKCEIKIDDLKANFNGMSIICSHLHFCLHRFEPKRVIWGAEEELSDAGSLRVIVYGYDGLPMFPVAPPSPDYPHDPDFMPEPIYPEYIQLEDEHVLLAEEQPLPPVVSTIAESPKYVVESDPEEEQPLPPIVLTIAESPEYVAESDPEEDPEEYDDDETKDGPVDYPMDEGDDDDGDSSEDDADDKDDDEEEEEEGETEPIIPPPSTDTATAGARITVRLQAAISFPPEAKVERLLAMPTPSPSPLASLSPPSAGERLARCTALDASPLPPPLHMPQPVDRMDDILETEMPPRKRLCLSTLGSRYEVEENFTARPTGGRGIDYGFVSTLDAEARRRGIGEVGYGIRDTWVDPIETVPEIAPMTTTEVNTRVTELAELYEHDTHDLFALLEDAQDRDMRREIGDMQDDLLALREQPRRAGQPGGNAKVPNHQDAPRDADSHI